MTEAKKLCIVVPYRDRASHLAQFIPSITSALKEQSVDGKILIVEQEAGKAFNRAKLLNVGFAYTKGLYDYYCFHDVDMLPIVSDYRYCSNPTHLAAEAEQFGWKLPYDGYFGGVTIFDRESFMKINGYSNEYWGWGAEDDDVFARCATLNIMRSRKACRYRSLSHDRQIDSKEYQQNLANLKRMNEGFRDGTYVDGLSNLTWKLLDERDWGAYTHIRVSI